MSIVEKAGQGFISFIYRNILARFLGVISLFVLAHKLSPADFGLVSITQVLLTLISALGSSGLFEYIQSFKRDDFAVMIKATFWFNIFTTTVLIFLFWGMLPFWAKSKNDIRILYIGVFLGLNFFLMQMQIIPRAVLSRDLEFKRLVKIQNPFIVITPIMNIASALGGLGVYSLVLPALILNPIQIYFMYRAIHWKWSFQFYRNKWKEIFNYSKYLIGNTILYRITDEGDKIILSSTLGLKSLGIYNMANTLAGFVFANLVSISGNILTSVIPKYSDDLEKMKHYYFEFIRTISFVSFPMILLILPFADELILIVNGPNWGSAVVPFQFLSLFFCFRCVTSSRGAILNAIHKNRVAFKMIFYYTPIYLASSFIWSYFYGVNGIAISLFIIQTVYAFWGVYITLKFINGKLIEYFQVISVSLIQCFITIVITVLIIKIIDFNIFINLLNFDKSEFKSAILIAKFLVQMTFIFIIYILVVRNSFKSNTKNVISFIVKVLPKSEKVLRVVFGKSLVGIKIN